MKNLMLILFCLTCGSEGLVQEPIPADQEPADVVASLRSRWKDAAGLSLTLSLPGSEATILCGPDKRLRVELTQPSYENGKRLPDDDRFRIVCDGARVVELDLGANRFLSHALEASGPPRSRATRLAYCKLPFLGGEGYWNTLLADVLVDEARFSKREGDDALRTLVLPARSGVGFEELHVAVDAESRPRSVFRLTRYAENGRPIGIRWKLDVQNISSEPPPGSSFEFDPPEGAVELPYSSFWMPRVGDIAPNFELETLAGPRFDLSTTLVEQRVVLVQFWGSWCGPCLREMPELQAAYESHGQHGLAVIGIACQDEKEKAEAAARRVGVTYPIAMDPEGWASNARRYGIRAFPTLLVIGSERRVLWHNHAGGDLESALERALE